MILKNLIKKAIINNSNDIISYNKSYIDGESINARYLGKVTEEDKEFLKENYKGKFYERRTFSIHTKDTAYQYSNNMTTNVFNFNSFYSNELEGLNIVDESFLKDILDIDEINILNETEYSSGVYITDYFADSMMFHNGYKNYEDFLSVYQEKGIDDNHNYARIKSIIKTNYKEKLKPLLDEINKGAKAIDLLSKEENYKYYDYLKLGLNSAFTFNPNFEINGDVNSVYTHWIDSSLGTIAYNNFKPLNFNKKNTMLLSGGFILSAYPLLKKEEVQKILDTTEFEICFRTNPSNENEIPYFKTKIKIDMKENYTNEIKDQKITGFANLLSEDLFKIFKEQSFFTIGFLFKDKSIYDLNNSLSDRKIELDNIYYTYSNNIATQVARFNDVFKILNVFCMVLSIFIMIYYAFSVIKDNKYNIGVLKSLGYRGNELSVFFFSSFLAYFVLTGALFGIIFNWLTRSLNHVLRVNLSKGLKMVSVESIPIVSFDLNIFLVVLSALLVSTLLFSLIYLFVLRKYKIIKVIQNKE